MSGCRVTLLDGADFEPTGISKNASGKELFSKVISHLNMVETDYFGITYRDHKSGKKYWLDPDKKISKQVNGGPWVFEFQVKFYTPDPMSMKEDITRYQLCLQLRVDIFNGKLPCSFATYALLGSYTVQSELGDWDPVENGPGIEYLHEFDFAPSQNIELLEKIGELHKHHKGLTPTVAEAHFLENAKKLAMFGVDLHDAKDSDAKDIQLGVCANGILVFKDRLRINRFVWPKILKLSYKRNNFYVRVRPGEFEPHERTIMFGLDNHKLAKRLWKTCVEHHAFFRLKETDPHQTDTMFPRFNTKFRYSGRTAHQARKAAEQVTRDEPHIARTAERRSLGHGDKRRSLDDGALQKRRADESDMYDKKHDPNATAELGPNAHAGLQDGQYRSGPSDVKANYMQLLSEKPMINSQTRWPEAVQQIQEDPRYHAVPTDDAREDWYNEYIQNLIKSDYMQMLHDTPSINSQTPYQEAQQSIYSTPQYQAVPTDALREQWYDEYMQNLKKKEFMDLLRDTPAITSNMKWDEAKKEIRQADPRYQAVPTDAKREEYFNEYTNPHKKEFMDLLRDTPAITSNMKWEEAKKELDQTDPRYQAVPTDAKREEYFNEYTNPRKKEFMDLLRDTPAITSNTKWNEAKKELNQSDPRYKAVPTDAEREEYFNEYIHSLGPPPYSPGDGKKDKKAKEEEKRRKKEEERRLKEEEKKRKEEEKERKRLEKEKKKHKGKGDGEHGDQEELEKDPGCSGGLFGMFGKKSQTDKHEKEEKEENEERVTPAATPEPEVKEEVILAAESVAEVEAAPAVNREPEEAEEEFVEQKPKPIMTWALPGMKEMMEKKAQSDQAKQEEETDITTVPRIEIDEAPPVSDSDSEPAETHETQSDNQSEVEQVVEPIAVELVEQSSTQVTYTEPVQDNTQIVTEEEAIQTEAAVIVKDVIEKAIEVVEAESAPSDIPVVLTDIQLKEEFTQLLRETPDVTSQSCLKDVKHKIEQDPRYKAVGSDDKREKWFNEYTDNLLKADFMRLLARTPQIHSQSTWREARCEIDLEPCFVAVNSEAKREEWFDEYIQNLLKQDYMQLLKDTPSVHSHARWEDVKDHIEADPRYLAVGNDAKREAWFDEHIQNLKKEEFMQMLRENPAITSYSHYQDAREDICNDPRFNNVDTETQREEYFNEFVENLKKEGFVHLLQDTPDITAYTPWNDAKCKIETDPRYHAVDSDLKRAKWYNEHVNRLAGIDYTSEFGMRIGDYKSIDRKQEYMPINPPNVTTRKTHEETMPFFEPADDADDVKKRVPPPIAKKPRGHSGYDSEEDRLLQNSTGVPVTVETETFKYSPDTDDMPKATSNIPIVETKTQKVTYEKDGIPYETEDSILISAHSVTNKSQTIDTTTYKTERDGVVETRVERKITVVSDGDEVDHDLLLRQAIEQVTDMNQSFEVHRVEYMRQLE